MERSRRSVVRAGIGLVAGIGLAGCSGGDSSNNSSANNSTVSNRSAPESAGSLTTPATVGTARTTVQAQILGSEPEYSSDRGLSIELSGDTTPDKIRLMSPKGKFATYQPESYDNRATFTLIKESSKQFGYEKYPYGTYHAIALKSGQPIDRQAYHIRPRFTVSEVESSSSRLSVTLQNIGTGPAAITAVRIYNANLTPGLNQWGGGFVDQDALVTPGDSIRVETRLMGFADQFPIKGNKSASDYDGKYCTGRVYPVTVSYRVFGLVQSTTGSLSFGGNPQEAPNGKSAVCSEYTLNLNADSGSLGTASTTSGTTTGGVRTLTSTARSASKSGSTTSTNSTSNS